MSAEFFYGVLAGAGALALAQNLGDYRIDQEFLEYVVNPVQTFVLHLFGKDARAKIEKKVMTDLHDTYAMLVNVQKVASQDVSKVGAEVDKVVEKVKEKLF